jgi:hypothetical protein
VVQLLGLHLAEAQPVVRLLGLQRAQSQSQSQAQSQLQAQSQSQSQTRSHA